ncbi:MAG: glycosyltransferase family 4 protein [Oscillatoriaceae cyanobacterium Prado104]|jgi:glycosyltransferase involved in cell wall biosynthesis|nr:glycosyltransferase family 4 protein [Oscillatoriaceae cyanobacterium Prado104]
MRSANYLFCFLEIFGSEGGIQSYVRDILKAYLSISKTTNYPSKAEVLLLRDSPDCDNHYESEYLRFFYLKTGNPWLGRLKFAAILLSFLLQKRPQRVFCGHIKLAPLIQSFCHPLGIPYTILTYGKEVWELLASRERAAMQQADSIWTISKYTRDRTCATNNLNPAKFQIIPCTVDGEIFDIAPKSEDLLTQYNLHDAQILLTVSRLRSSDFYKGIDVTIQALPHIAKNFPNVKYLVVGRGDDRPRLAQLAADLGVAERVVFAGFVATENLAAYYQLADAFVMPSQEGFGIVYLEALACGLPVLAGNADGSADPLQDGKLGWRVPHRNSEAVALACIEILQGNDPRCDRDFLREQTLAAFSSQSLCRLLLGIFQLSAPD